MKKTILAVIALFALTGCSKNDEAMSLTADNEVRISSSIATRTSGNDWEDGDAIGVYMSTNGGTFAGLGSNVLYTTTETNGLGNFTSDDPLYFPASGNVDLLAYYPYVEGTEENPFDVTAYPVDVTSQSDQGAIDLLSESITGQILTNSAVEMLFDHKLSRIALTLEAGDGLETADLDGLVITLLGTYVKASYDLTEASDSPITLSETADIVMLTADGGQSSEAIVIPQTLTGVSLTFETTDYGIFEVALPTEAFTVGNEYIYKVTLNRTGVTISNQTINEWGEGDEKDLNADPVVNIELSGDGDDKTYNVYTAEGLEEFAILVNSGNADINCTLMNNIDLESEEWTPIGSTETPFTGTFDGNGKEVKNLYINTDVSYQALFGYVYDAKIKNIGVTSGDVTTTGFGNQYIGGIVGRADYSTISNCYNLCNVTATGSDTSDIGGIVGCAYCSEVSGCYNTGNIYGKYRSIGGVAGSISSDTSGDRVAIIINCYNKGSITGTHNNTYSYVGGVVGQVTYATFITCYNAGKVSGYGHVGGVAGRNRSYSEITYSYYDTTVAGSIGAVYKSDDEENNVIGLTTTQMQDGTLLYYLTDENYGNSDAWFEDTKGINGGYPILDWQVSE